MSRSYRRNKPNSLGKRNVLASDDSINSQLAASRNNFLSHEQIFASHFCDKPNTKESTVAHVIEKVTQWHRLYNGYYDEDFNYQRLSLEAAADQVGVSKKSLDDYSSQLRSGRRQGYNFNQFKHAKISHLRKFVKGHLELQKQELQKQEFIDR